jgi:hypothetical protein
VFQADRKGFFGALLTCGTSRATATPSTPVFVVVKRWWWAFTRLALLKRPDGLTDREANLSPNV